MADCCACCVSRRASWCILADSGAGMMSRSAATDVMLSCVGSCGGACMSGRLAGCCCSRCLGGCRCISRCGCSAGIISKGCAIQTEKKSSGNNLIFHLFLVIMIVLLNVRMNGSLNPNCGGTWSLPAGHQAVLQPKQLLAAARFEWLPFPYRST